MDDHETVVAQVMTRAEELMASGGGRVDVATIHDIAEVRLLRSCKATLTDDELAAVQQLRGDLAMSLNGVEVASAPPATEVKSKLAMFLAPVLALGKMFTSEQPQTPGFDQMNSAAGGPTQLPVPRALLDAAEAWTVATLAADRVDDSLDFLRTPWETATVNT